MFRLDCSHSPVWFVQSRENHTVSTPSLLGSCLVHMGLARRIQVARTACVLLLDCQLAVHVPLHIMPFPA